MFNKDTSRAAGAKGGSTRSVVKSLAARANGRRGGRPSSLCFAERLLSKKIKPADEKPLQKAWDELYPRDKQQVLEYFGISSVFDDALCAREWKTKKKHLPSDVKLFVEKFKLAAKTLPQGSSTCEAQAVRCGMEDA